jgi:hypothetical protein
MGGRFYFTYTFNTALAGIEIVGRVSKMTMASV